jgi:SET domain-containing protein
MEHTKVNVAPSSSHGHYIEEAEKVVAIDEVKEMFFSKSKSKLTTTNHTTLVRDEPHLITCQNVYNPFSKMFERPKD